MRPSWSSTCGRRSRAASFSRAGLRSDLRFLGEEHDFSWRLRYRLMVEKELKPRGHSVVPYASVEPYYDSRHEKVSRVRPIGGASVGFGKRFALEGNVTYQTIRSPRRRSSRAEPDPARPLLSG